MNSKKQAAVIIPFYKTDLSELEKISLAQCMKTLAAHVIIAVKPVSLDLTPLSECNVFSKIISFDNSFFKGVRGYNELMLSPVFYQQFLEFEYILIYQLDAFVFRDELLQWCNKGYDYIGAPWLKLMPDSALLDKIRTRIITRYYIFKNIYENDLPSDRQFDNMVGNGGFSLRRVKKFYQLSIKFQSKIQEYNKRDEHQFHEDVFWSIEVNRKRTLLKIPGFKKALLFSFENHVEQSMYHTHNRLPFGCHAWDLYPDFWQPYFEKCGYLISISGK
jgi:hypothetical protein